MKKLLSGVKPTGRPHIGNYFGAMKQFVDLQNDYESYIFIADLHALTSVKDPKKLSENIIEEMIDYLAIGLDPKKVTVFKQSDLSQVTELAWIFECLVSMPYLMRAHAYKDSVEKEKEINAGVFNYPMLMAADILIHNADVVPVGNDQKQHIEYARDVAEKFNKQYGDTFKLPNDLILKDLKNVPGIDGQKMSKSYNNTIPLFATKDEIKKLVMQIPTDSKGIDDSKDPDKSIIFELNSLFINDDEKQLLRERFLNGGLGYKEAKENLIRDIDNFLSPLRDKREEISKDKDRILKLLQAGGEKVKNEVIPFVDEIRKKVGIKLY